MSDRRNQRLLEEEDVYADYEDEFGDEKFEKIPKKNNLVKTNFELKKKFKPRQNFEPEFPYQN